jgi:hypothetical protein
MVSFVCALSGCESCVELESSIVLGGRYVGLDAFEIESEVVLSAVDFWDGSVGELVLARLDGSHCSAGPVSGYAPVPGDAFGSAWAALARFTAEGDVGALSFSDFRCGDLPGHLEGIVGSPFAWPLGGGWLQVIGGDGSHFVVHPFSGESARIAQPGSWAVACAPDRFWVHEAGGLWLRAFDGSDLREIATDVTEMTVVFTLSGDAISASGVAWADASGVHLLDGPDDLEADLLTEEACRIAPMWTETGPALGWLSPCAEQRFVIHDLATGDERVIASGVTAFSLRADPAIFVVGETVGDRVGDLYLAPPGGEPVFVAERADLSSLDRQDYDTPPYFLVLADHDGEAGTLLQIAGDGAAIVWKEGVVAFDRRGDHVAFVADLAGAGGSLHLRGEHGGENVFLASGVPPGAFAFGWQIPAIGFIADASAEGGRLVLRQIDGALESEIDRGVTELVEVVSAERPGVAYLIGSGERAGIWFAEP